MNSELQQDGLKDEKLNQPPSEGGVTKFSDSRQRAIWKELGALDPVFGPRIANIYEGIVLSLEGNNPEKISIVSHLARELTGILSIYKPIDWRSRRHSRLPNPA